MSPAAYDVGRCREQGPRSSQQDASGSYQAPGRAFAAAVADGLGSYEGSDRAAEAAVSAALRASFAVVASPLSGHQLRQAIEAAVSQAHEDVLREQRQGEHAGRTTLALLVVVGERAGVAHVGDSRVYRLRDSVLEQLTKDHRYNRHTLSRCLGSWREEADCTPDVLETDAQADDVWLLATDGVADSLTPAQLRAVLEDAADAQVAAQALVTAALAAGSRDNCTAVVVRCPGVPVGDVVLMPGHAANDAQPRGAA